MLTTHLTTKTTGRPTMSKFDFAKLREQVKQTNESLREEFKGTDNQIEGNNNRGEEWRSNVRASLDARNSNPEFKEKQKQWFKDSEEARINAVKDKWKDESYRKKMADSNRKNAQDPVWLEKVRDNANKRKGSQEWSDKMSLALKEKYKDPEARAKIAESNRKKAQDPAIRKKLSEIQKNRYKDPLEIEKAKQRGIERTKTEKWKIDSEKRSKASVEVTSRPIMTRHGAFPSKIRAAEYYKVDGANIGYWLKAKPSEFYNLSKEEYEKIKHIPLKTFEELPHPSRKKNKQLK